MDNSIGKIRIRKKTLLWSFLLICLFPPGYFVRVSIISNLFDVILVVISISIIVISIREKVRLDKFLILILILEIYLFFITVLNEGDLLYSFKQILRVFFVCYLCSRFIDFDCDCTIEAFCFVFHIYMVINTLTLFLFPNAMYLNGNGSPVCWFLGEDNVGFAYYLFGNVTAMMYELKKKKKLSYLSMFSFFLSFHFAFRNDIGTGKLCCVVISILIILSYLKYFQKVFNIYFCYLFQGLYFVLVILLRIQNQMGDIVAEIFNRNVSFSGRTVIWNTTLTYIAESPLWGYGIYGPHRFNHILGIKGIYSAHNYYLMLCFWGGIIALLLFLFVAVIMDKMNGNHNFDNALILSGIFTYMLRLQNESSPYELLFILLMFYAYYNKLFGNKEEHIIIDN